MHDTIKVASEVLYYEKYLIVTQLCAHWSHFKDFTYLTLSMKYKQTSYTMLVRIISPIGKYDQRCR